MSSAYVPDRGDVVWIDMDPQSGREQAGRRPALILSPRHYNAKAGLVLLCPVTSQAKRYPFEVSLPGGYAISGVILADQVKSLDWRTRAAEFACKVDDIVFVETVKHVYRLLTR